MHYIIESVKNCIEDRNMKDTSHSPGNVLKWMGSLTMNHKKTHTTLYAVSPLLVVHMKFFSS